MAKEKDIIEDGCDAFYAGAQLEDNPWPEFDHRFDTWDRDWMEAYKNYKQDGRFRDGTFKG